MKKITSHFFIIWSSVCVTLIFCLLAATDIFPIIRGPWEENIPARWPYYFVNTFSKIWAPLCIGTIALFYYSLWIKKSSKQRELFYVVVFVVIVFLFQLSVVFFSRFGMSVLFRRVVHPGMSGYFTAALTVSDPLGFFQNFPRINNTLSQHAPTHPPGIVIVMKAVIDFFTSNKNITNFLYMFIREPTGEVKYYWDLLTKPQRVAAISIGFLSHALASCIVIPFYCIVRKIYSKNVAVNGTYLLAFTPSLTFFAPLFDPVYSMLPLISFYVFLRGYYSQKLWLIGVSGFIFACGFLFSVSILPLLGIGLVYSFYEMIRKKNPKTGRFLLAWFYGFCMLFIILTFLNIQFLAIYIAITQVALHRFRSYYLSLIFNPYDFFIFLGIPTSVSFIIVTMQYLKKKYTSKKLFFTIPSFWIVFFVLTLSGASRGEVGRIWLPFMVVPIFGCIRYLSDLEKKYFLLLIVLLFLQILVMEEFWVPLW